MADLEPNGNSAQPAGMLGPGTVIAGRYRIVELLARGGMSRVYVAEDQRLGRQIALKFLDFARFSNFAESAIARRRFYREARVSASLEHDHIIEVHDVGEHDDVPFMAMRRIEGKTLGRCIRDGVLPAPEDGIRVLREVVTALAYAHAHGILHRDLKPDNIMLDAQSRAIVVDFGLAWVPGETADTGIGSAVGTPAYLAPEIFAGKPASRATDQFSAGVTFFEWLTGSYPFRRETLIYSISYEEALAPTSLRATLPPPLEAVLLRMIAKDPGDRYPDLDALVADLARLDGPAAGPDGPGRDDEEFQAWRNTAGRAHL